MSHWEDVTLGGCQVDSSGVKVVGVQWDSIPDQLSFDIRHISNAVDEVQQPTSTTSLVSGL